MQKIGINKSKNNIKYFNIIRKNKSININKDIKEIRSIIIKSYIIDCCFIKIQQSIRLTLKVDIKIIYAMEKDTSLYVYQDTYINFSNIKVPKIIDGNFIYDKFFERKIIKEVYVENINSKLVNSNILVSYFLTVSIKLKSNFYLSYIINNGLSDNIFLSYLNGENLVQKTFTPNLTCFNLKYQPSSNKIYFLGSINNISNIYVVNEENTNVNKLTNIDTYENITYFNFKNENEIIFTKNIENTYNIYNFNIKRNSIKKIIKDEDLNINTCPYYDRNKKVLYFLSERNHNDFLYVIDEESTVKTIFDSSNVIGYYVSYSGNNLILKINKEDKICLYLLNYDSMFLSIVNTSFEYEDILDVKFIYDDDFNKKIIILIKEESSQNNNTENKNKLVLYDLNTYEYEFIFKGDIVSFEIDYITLDIYIINKVKMFFYIEKINLNDKKETILKLSSKIKEIDIKKVFYEE